MKLPIVSRQAYERLAEENRHHLKSILRHLDDKERYRARIEELESMLRTLEKQGEKK